MGGIGNFCLEEIPVSYANHIFGIISKHDDDISSKLEMQWLVDGKSDRLPFVESKSNTCCRTSYVTFS